MPQGILIEPIVNNKPHGFSVQGKRFSFSMKITNCSDSPSKEFTISKIYMSSESGQNLTEDFGAKSFYVGIMNPCESITISIADSGQFMYGLISLRAEITPKESSTPIMFLQKNPFSGEIISIGNNRWVDFCYMKSMSEYTQETSNEIMIWLTVVILFLTILQVGKIFDDEIKQLYNFIRAHSSDSSDAFSQYFTVFTAMLVSLSYTFILKRNNKNGNEILSKKLKFFINSKK